MEVPVDHKCAIRQSFAAFLLLTPLFFSEFLVQFLGLNEKGMETRTYIGWETPVTREGGRATGPLPPARDLFANS